MVVDSEELSDCDNDSELPSAGDPKFSYWACAFCITLLLSTVIVINYCHFECDEVGFESVLGL